MNNRQLQYELNETPFWINRLSLISLSCGALMIFVTVTFAQRATWKYAATLPGGVKTYLNDETKTLPNKNTARWEKITKPDGSFAVALVEWNCAKRVRLIRQLTFYAADQTAVLTKNTGFEWTPIIPGAAGDYLYYRVCDPAPLITAEIIADRTALRVFPHGSARIARSANKGETFVIAPESGQNNWYNIVDAATQEDYWVVGDAFRMIVSAPPKQRVTRKVKNNSSRRQSPRRRVGGKQLH